MHLYQWIILVKVVNAVSDDRSAVYQWPVCHRSYTYETEQGTGLPVTGGPYMFVGSFESVPCAPISFDRGMYSHMDLNVTSAPHVLYNAFTFTAFINPSNRTGTVLHYRSADLEQHFILFVQNGKLGMKIYQEGSKLVSSGYLERNAITTKNWFLVALIVKSLNNFELQLQLSGAPQTMSISSSRSSVQLNVPGQLRIGSMFEQVTDGNGVQHGPEVNDEHRFHGQMMCVQMYQIIFETAFYTNAIDQCQSAAFPNATLIPTTPRTICSPYDRNDLLFTRVHDDRALLSQIHDLRQIRKTSLRKCAIYCTRNPRCVSFTVTKNAEEYRTCRLFPVYNTAYVTTNIDTDLYVINLCT